MTCIRNCTLRNHHLDTCTGDCRGCLPRPSDEGFLCDRCYRRLTTLVGPSDDPESLSGAVRWLESNNGQFLRSSTGGGGGGGGSASTYGDHMAAAISHAQVIAQSVKELAADFGAPVAALHLYTTRLANWEPIGDHLDHLESLIETAHSIAPWRAKQDKTLHTAALLYLLPPETPDELAARFNIASSWVRRQKQLGHLTPEGNTKPYTYRPWDVYALLEPEKSIHLLADLMHYKGSMAYSTAA